MSVVVFELCAQMASAAPSAITRTIASNAQRDDVVGRTASNGSAGTAGSTTGPTYVAPRGAFIPE